MRVVAGKRRPLVSASIEPLEARQLLSAAVHSAVAKTLRAHPNLLAARHHVRLTGSPRSAVSSGATPAYAASASAALPSWVSSNSAAWDASTGTLTVTGPATITADPGSDEPLVNVSGAAAALTIQPISDQVIHLGSLTLTNGGSAEVSRPNAGSFDESSSIAVVVGTGSNSSPVLSIDSANGSTLGLEDNDLIVRQGAANQSAFLGGVSVQSPGTFAIGTLSGADYEQDTLPILGLGGEGPIAPLQLAIGTQSVPVDPGDMLVKYTYVGSAAPTPGGTASASSSSTPSASSDSATPASGGMASPGFAMAYSAPASTPLSGIAPADVSSVVVNANIPALAGVQRSMVNSIVYTFSEAVTLNSTTAFSIAVSSGQTGTVPTLNWSAISPDGGGASTQWVVTFSGAGVTGGSIADGVYDITLNTAAVTSEANPTVPAQPHNTDTFYRFFGDAGGTGRVDNADYTAFNSTYGLKSTDPRYLAYFADDGTNKIDTADYNAFLNNYGKRLTGLLSFNPAALEPTSVAAMVNGSTSVTIAWTAPPNAVVTSYSIQRWSVADQAWEPLVQNLSGTATSYTDTTSQPDTAYEYQVAAQVSGRMSDWSLSSNDVVTQVAAPSGLSATPMSTTEIDLFWANNDPNATGIEVLRSTDGTTFTALPALAASATSFADTGLNPSTHYWYEVIVSGPGGSSAPVTADASTPSIYAPSGLSASAASASEVDLSWTNNSTTATGIEVDRSTDGINFSPIATGLPPTTTSYSDTGVLENTSYWYQVQATGPGSVSLVSPPTEAWTLPAVDSLQAVAISASEIDLSWNSNAPDATGFQVQWSPDSGATWNALPPLSAGTTSYQDTGLSEASARQYQVCALMPGGVSSQFSVIASATTLPAPASGFAAVANGQNEIDLSWTANDPSTSSYDVQRWMGGSGYQTIATLDPGTTSYADTGLDDGTPYSYQLVAEDAGGQAAPSAVATATTDVAPPSSLIAETVTGAAPGIHLYWVNNSSSVYYYDVQRSTDGQNFTTIGQSSDPEWFDGEGAPGTHYYYRVVADTGVTTSAPSNVADASTLASLTLSGALWAAEEQSYSLTVSANSSGSNPLTSLAIDWGDGKVDSVAVQGGVFSHVYDIPGSGMIVVTGQSPQGPVQASVPVSIGPRLMTVSGTSDAQTGMTYTLTADFSPSTAAEVTNYHIDWGDGQVQDLAGNGGTSFSHTYVNAGAYTVDLAATTQHDGIFSGTTYVTIGSPIDSGSAGYLSAGVYANQALVEGQGFDLSIQFCGSEPPPSSFTVDFGDGSGGEQVPADVTSNDSSGAIVPHTYAEEGAYKVTVSDGSDQVISYVTVAEDHNSPWMATVPWQYVSPGDPVNISANVTGLDPTDPAAAYVNWGDGKGFVLAQVAITGSDSYGDTGVVTATLAHAPADVLVGAVLKVFNADGDSAYSEFRVYGTFAVTLTLEPSNPDLGNLIVADGNDLNGDGLPDYVDTAQGLSGGSLFTPLALTCPQAYPSTATVVFTYSDATLGTSGSPAGDLRLWRRDPSNPSFSPSDYIPSGSVLNLADLAGGGIATLYVEAVQADSGSGDSIEAKATFAAAPSGYTGPATFPATLSGSASVTTAQPKIDVMTTDGTNVPIPVGSKNSTGGYVMFNNDNDNGKAMSGAVQNGARVSVAPEPDFQIAGPTPGEHDLVPIVLRATSYGEYRITYTPGVKLWGTSNKSATKISGNSVRQVTSGMIFDATQATTLYVEGTEVGSSEIYLWWSPLPSIANAWLPVDAVKENVFQVAGAQYVPGLGNYTYAATVPGGTANFAGWQYDNGSGSLVSDHEDSSQVNVTFGAGPAIGEAVYSPAPGFQGTWKVYVVSITVDPGSVAKTPGGGVATAAGPNAPLNLTAAGKISWSNKVTIQGPADPVLNQQRGVIYMQAGYVQTATIASENASYADGSVFHNAALQGKSFIDMATNPANPQQVNSQWPWYDSSAHFGNKAVFQPLGTNAKAPAPSFVLQASDKPSAPVPQKSLTNANALLTGANVQFNFDLQVAVRTLDAETNGPISSTAQYMEEADVNWGVDYSSKLVIPHKATKPGQRSVDYFFAKAAVMSSVGAAPTAPTSQAAFNTGIGITGVMLSPLQLPPGNSIPPNWVPGP